MKAEQNGRELIVVFLTFQFVADGVFKAELNEFLTRELAEDGYSGNKLYNGRVRSWWSWFLFKI